MPLRSHIITFILLVLLQPSRSSAQASPEIWHLDSIELSRSIPLGGGSIRFDTTFQPSQTGDRYEARLFFPGLAYHEYDPDTRKAIRLNIIHSLEGLDFSVTNADDGTVVKSYQIRFGDKRFRWAFNENNPISLWLVSKVHLLEGQLYRISLSVPVNSERASAHRNAVFVIGMGKKIFP